MYCEILVIEDQKAMAMLLKARIEMSFDVKVRLAHSLAEAQNILSSASHQITIALCDLNLPDAPNGESVALVRKEGVTPIVLTANYDEKVRERMYQQRVADFVLKEGAAAIEYVLKVLKLLINNHERVVWLANLSDRMMIKLSGLLSVQRFNVQTFDQVKGLERALENTQPDLLILGDANITSDWFIEVSKIRAKYKFFELPIIACIETEQGEALGLRYMKYGTNDFIVVPFSAEALYARIHQNIEQQVAYKEIEYISRTDALSGLFNRRYCLEKGEALLNQAPNKGNSPFCGLIDIDFFKRINDRYGHPKGDEAIRFTAKMLSQHFSDYIVGRFGGEEFIVIGAHPDRSMIAGLAENFRHAIEQESEIELGVHFTVSMGLAFEGENLEQMIALADQRLYHAKDKGRNQVCQHFEERG